MLLRDHKGIMALDLFCWQLIDWGSCAAQASLKVSAAKAGLELQVLLPSLTEGWVTGVFLHLYTSTSPQSERMSVLAPRFPGVKDL